MEQDKKELNLIDVFSALWRGIVKCCKACCNLAIWCLRYLYRHKGVSLAFLVAGMAAGFVYYELMVPYRSGFLLNIPTKMPYYGVEYINAAQKYKVPELAEYLSIDEKEASKLKKMEAYYVVDCGYDGNIDFVDYKTKYGTDTLINTWSRNRFQVELLTTEEECVPLLKDALVRKFCSIPVFADSWEVSMKDFEGRIKMYRDELLAIDSVEQKLYSMDNRPSIRSRSTYNGMDYFTENRVQIFAGDRQYIAERISWAEKHYYDELSLGPISSTMPIIYYGKDKSLPVCIVAFAILGLCACIVLCLFVENRKKITAFLEK